MSSSRAALVPRRAKAFREVPSKVIQFSAESFAGTHDVATAMHVHGRPLATPVSGLRVVRHVVCRRAIPPRRNGDVHACVDYFERGF